MGVSRMMTVSASVIPVVDSRTGKFGARVPTIVDVDLGDRSYPIYIGSGLLNEPDLLQRLWIVQKKNLRLGFSFHKVESF